MLNSSAATYSRPVPWWQMVLALVWLGAFAGCFYRFDLPNSNPKVNRTLIWEQLPALLVNAVDPPEPAAKDLESHQLWKQAGWRYLPQRFGLYGISLAILAGAWGWGNLLLRLMWVSVNCWTLERTFFGLVCGLSMVSLLTLGCGLAGGLSRTILAGLLAVGVVCELAARLMTFSSTDLAVIGDCVASLHPRRSWPLLLVLPFLMCYVGGAYLPETDFDVKEYHFGGPKEWFLAGRISFLPHNVYTSFPFLTEMLTLLGMVLYGDWYWGALAGKGVLMSFAPLTALGLFVAGRRWFSPQAGAWAAFIHLSTPWIYRISIIAYAEGGIALYLFAALLAVMWCLDADWSPVESVDNSSSGSAGPWVILSGFLAGSAMSCKYPGLVSVVIPLGVVLLVHAYRSVGWALLPVRSSSLPAHNSKERPSKKDGQECPSYRPATWRWEFLRTGLVYSVGVALAVGPWLIKNLVETGNPVYPLLYSVFGGTDWNGELDAKWKHAHSPDHHQLADLAVKLMDVTLKSDWLSPLLFGLAPLALLTNQRRRVGVLWLYVGFLFGTWWLLTHRIDRFWVPLIPVVSLLAGVGATWNAWQAWRWLIRTAVALAATFNLAFMTSSLCGYNAYLLDLDRAAEQTARITAPEVVMLNSQLPAGSKVLCVGEAELFDARFPYVYNTVFDKSLFEEWCGVADPRTSSLQRSLKPVADIRQILKQQGITHVFVNWQEILRYRLTYGYTDFVSPKRFAVLQAMGILGPDSSLPGGQAFQTLDERNQQEVRRWAPELIRDELGQPVFKTFEVFPIVP